MSNECLQTYILVQHDAVVHDSVFIAKGERIAANVPKNAKKEGTSILLVQIPLGLSAKYLQNNYISILSCSRRNPRGSWWDLSKRLIDSSK